MGGIHQFVWGCMLVARRACLKIGIWTQTWRSLLLASLETKGKRVLSRTNKITQTFTHMHSANSDEAQGPVCPERGS